MPKVTLEEFMARFPRHEGENRSEYFNRLLERYLNDTLSHASFRTALDEEEDDDFDDFDDFYDLDEEDELYAPEETRWNPLKKQRERSAEERLKIQEELPAQIERLQVKNAFNRPQNFGAQSASFDAFFADVVRYADCSGAENAKPCYFQWPVYYGHVSTNPYSLMNEAQRSYYFHLRVQWQSEEEIDCDVPGFLSYFFLYLNEIQVGYGWQTPEEVMEKLQKLADQLGQYNDDYESASLFFSTVRTAYSFAVRFEKQLSVPSFAPAWWMNVWDEKALSVLLWRLEDSSKPLYIPDNALQFIGQNVLGDSKFFLTNMPLVMQALSRTLAMIDAWLKRKKGKGLLSVFVRTRERREKLPLFGNLIVCAADYDTEVEFRNIFDSRKFQKFVCTVAFQVDNELRRIHKKRKRTRLKPPEAPYADLIAQFIEREYDPHYKKKQQARNRIELDFSSISELRRQSDEVREALRVEDEQTPETAAEEPAVSAAESFWNQLKPAEKELLQQLVWKQGLPRADIANALYTGLNRKAREQFARPLLYTRQKQAHIQDEYFEELSHLAGPAPQLTENTEPRPAAAADSAFFALDRLEDDLRSTVQALAPYQQEALAAAVREDSAALEAIAEREFLLPETLVEQINDLAMEELGDILLEDTGTVTVLDEYKDALQGAV